jgi:hypothetical protein
MAGGRGWGISLLGHDGFFFFFFFLVGMCVCGALLQMYMMYMMGAQLHCFTSKPYVCLSSVMMQKAHAFVFVKGPVSLVYVCVSV